jgi:F-type H+-transporting ATPase subunit alpha
MAELTIRPDEIRAALDSFVKSYEPETVVTEEVGRVVLAGDGIAQVEGLPGAMANELLRFEDGTLGLALNLDVRTIGVVILGEFTGVEEGQVVRRTGEVLSVAVGDGYLGRVVDPLGAPIDGLGEIETVGRRALELQAPGVMARKSVHEPLQTGLKAIDAMIPIGRGQRQLIIGDRQTGKTAIAIDTIINQKDNWETGDPSKQVRCIYVAIGQKGSTIAAVRGALEEAGALEYTTIVAAPASDPAGFKYLAPYTGSAIGQHWMYEGKHVLIVFDDLSKQAEAYRAVSLLLRRPPGREAYPGDVFYLHSRLLERCAKLSDELGAGSMTGLPVIETKANDVSAYIPTNVISITDGQIFLQSDLFNADQRPAVDVGISVSRVGGSAQIKAMKKVSGTLKLDLAQFRSLEAFAMFASDLDPASRAQLARGARLLELLKQPQYSPYPVEDQVASIWAGTKGKLDDVPVDDVRRFEAELIDHLRRNTEVLTTIKSTGKLEDATEAALTAAVDEFRNGFLKGDGSPLVGGDEENDESAQVDAWQATSASTRRGSSRRSRSRRCSVPRSSSRRRASARLGRG